MSSGPRTPKRSRRRVASAARVQLKVAGIQQFAQSAGLTREGVFIETRKPLPEGRDVQLRVVTVDGRLLFVALCSVGWTQPPWRREPHVAGMWLNFTYLPNASRVVLDQFFGPASVNLKAPVEEEATPISSEIPDVPAAPADELPEIILDVDELIQSIPRPTAPMNVPAVGSGIVVGIDLGTTYTCAAYLRDGEPVVIPLDDSVNTMPSIVSLTDSGDVIVGRTAYERMAEHPRETIYASKRLLGRKFGSAPVKDAQKYLGYEVVRGDGGDAAVRVHGEDYSLPWVSARILEEVINWVRHYTGEPVSQAVITVPAHYNTRQRQAVVHAARMAGLRARQIVNEPTAASLAYGIDKGFNKRVMVYDLGGGTFDVAILELQGNAFEVLATGGDPYLGGNDFDSRIVDWLLSQFKKKTGVDLSGNPVVRTRLRQAAESAKRRLTDEEATRIDLPYIARVDERVLNLAASLKRVQLNNMVTDLADRTLEICERVLQSASLQRSDIDDILLVGGMTRMPLIQGKVAAFLGKRPRMGVHPDEAIAVGAALLGRALEAPDSVELNDLVGQPIGIALGSKFRPVIRKNTSLPVEKQVTIPTLRDNQRAMSVDVYQGDSGRLEGNEYLGTVEIKKIPARPKGEIKIQIHFAVDDHGFLTVYTSHSESERRTAVPLVVKERGELAV